MQLFRSFVEDRPLNELLFSGGNQPPEQRETEAPPDVTTLSFSLGQRFNASFEQFGGDAQLHATSEWRFHHPVAHNVTEGQHDIGRLLRSLGGDSNPLPHETLRQFEPLSRYLNTLKTRINRCEADLDEYDFTRYITLLDMQSLQTANGPCLFAYLVPTDNDGVHHSEACSQQTLIHSDEFAFERLHVLLSLLAFHQRRLDATPIAKEKTLLLRNCIDVLREILRLTSPISGGGKRRLYRHQLSSISSSSSTTKQNQNPSNVTLEQVLAVCLGGQAGIHARIFLCQARRCEIILADQRAQSAAPEDEQALLGAIAECYRQAHDSATVSSHPDGKLVHHTKFAHQLSMATAQLSIVQRLYENEDASNSEVEEAFQRAASVVRQHDEYAKMPRPFAVDPTMRDCYRNTLLAINTLYKKIDRETGQQIEIDRSREYSVLTDRPYQFDEQRQSTFERAMEWSRTDLSFDHSLHLDTLVAILSNQWQQQQQPVTNGGGERSLVTPFRLPVEVRGALERGDVDTAASIGIVIERRNWLRAVLAEEGPFILNVKYRPQFGAELEQTEKALAYYTKSALMS